MLSQHGELPHVGKPHREPQGVMAPRREAVPAEALSGHPRAGGRAPGHPQVHWQHADARAIVVAGAGAVWPIRRTALAIPPIISLTAARHLSLYFTSHISRRRSLTEPRAGGGAPGVRVHVDAQAAPVSEPKRVADAIGVGLHYDARAGRELRRKGLDGWKYRLYVISTLPVYNYFLQFLAHFMMMLSVFEPAPGDPHGAATFGTHFGIHKSLYVERRACFSSSATSASGCASSRKCGRRRRFFTLSFSLLLTDWAMAVALPPRERRAHPAMPAPVALLLHRDEADRDALHDVLPHAVVFDPHHRHDLLRLPRRVRPPGRARVPRLGTPPPTTPAWTRFPPRRARCSRSSSRRSRGCTCCCARTRIGRRSSTRCLSG